MSQECVGFGAVQDVAVGLVQPASAVLYDYYNPGERTGDTREVWDRRQGRVAGKFCGSMGLESREGGLRPNAPVCFFSRAQMFCVLRGTN